VINAYLINAFKIV